MRDEEGNFRNPFNRGSAQNCGTFWGCLEAPPAQSLHLRTRPLTDEERTKAESKRGQRGRNHNHNHGGGGGGGGAHGHSHGGRGHAHGDGACKHAHGGHSASGGGGHHGHGHGADGGCQAGDEVSLEIVEAVVSDGGK